jgi:hypothetical protein
LAAAALLGGSASAARPEAPMALGFSLKAKVAKGEVAPVDELSKRYAVPTEHALVDWLKSQGFEVTSVTNNRTSVYAHATTSAGETACPTRLASQQTVTTALRCPP